MRISFDLDDTLICYDPKIPREANRVSPLWRWKYNEPMRLGAVDLVRQLQNEGHEIWIYTTSFRNPKDVRRWLGFYGFKTTSVINADLHSKLVSRQNRSFSKFPSHFQIALHIDDEDFSEMGAKFGFVWLTVSPYELNWTDKVLKAVQDITIAN